MRKIPSKTQWWKFLKAPHHFLNKLEITLFFVFFISFLLSTGFLLFNFYLEHTKLAPAIGGELIEGVVGYPHFINPIYAEANDVDRDLVELIFCGLMKYNSEGEIVPDLAKEYKILEEGKIYEFELKPNIFWEDGKEITADDVVFTIETIQNPKIKSPLFSNWLGVKVKKISQKKVRFELENPYVGFLERVTVKIIPKHIWEKVSPENFPLVKFNLEPIGCGPYKLENIATGDNGKILSLGLNLNKEYFGNLPYIEKITFKFFNSEKELGEALNLGEINSALLETKEIKNPDFKEYLFTLPRYFAVFFNLGNKENKIISQKETRIALSYATDKKEILERVLHGNGEIVNSPILSSLYNLSPPSTTFELDLEKAKEILKKANFEEKDGKLVKIIKKEPPFLFTKDLKLGDKGKDVEELQKCLAKDEEVYPLKKIDGEFDIVTKNAVIRFQKKYRKEISEIAGYEIKCTGYVGKATRKELNKICFPPEIEEIPFKLKLVTLDHPILKETAFILKKQWEKIGAQTEVILVSSDELEREIIKNRDYELLLFGQILGKIPDPFAFWHSSQRRFGLNIAEYENEKVDKLLEKVREELDEKKRKESYEEIQEEILKDIPAIFLYNFPERYFVAKEIKGIENSIIVDPSKRFSQIEKWYIETKRVWK